VKESLPSVFGQLPIWVRYVRIFETMRVRGLPLRECGATQPTRKGLSMTNAEHDRRSSSRRKKQAIAGVVGLAAVLGGGAFLVTDRVADDARTVATDAKTPALPSSASPAPRASAVAGPSKAAAASSGPAAPAPAASTARKSAAQAVAEVKGSAAKATGNVKRPLTPQAAGTVSEADVQVTETGSLQDPDGTLKVVSARADLTGQRELAWVTGVKGEKVGAARCSQTIRLSPDVPPRERPTFLMCWRTSADRSVYTIAVNLKERPSKAASVAAINRAWSALS
jgi:hypothetical protein